MGEDKDGNYCEFIIGAFIFEWGHWVIICIDFEIVKNKVIC